MIPIICCLDLHNGLSDAIFVFTPGLGHLERCFENTNHLMVLLGLQFSKTFHIQFFKNQELLVAFYMFQMSIFKKPWPSWLCPQMNKSYDCFIVSQESRTFCHIVGTQCMFVEQMNKSLPFSFSNATVFMYSCLLKLQKSFSK